MSTRARHVEEVGDPIPGNRSRPQIVLLILFGFAMMAIGGSALAIRQARENDVHQQAKVNNLLGGFADVRSSVSVFANRLYAYPDGAGNRQQLEISFGLARRQVDVVTDDLEVLGDAEASRLHGELTDLLNQAAIQLEQAAFDSRGDAPDLVALENPLAATSRQLVDRVTLKTVGAESNEAISEGLEIFVLLMPIFAVGLLFAAMRVMQRDVRAAFTEAKARLITEDAHRRRAERLAHGQAMVLEMVAAGSPIGEVSLAVAGIVEAESDGNWTVGETGVETSGPDPDPDPAPADLVVLTERLLDVVRERDRVTDELVHEATHDALTGLVNRATITDHVDRVLRQRNRPGQSAFLFIDLDRFKKVNDTLGHHVGDGVLSQVARRLQDTVRDGDIVGRLGGDEFGIFLPDASREAAQLAAERVVQVISERFFIEDFEIDVRVSVGIAVASSTDNDVEVFLREADQAMYHAKDTGQALVEINDDLRSRARERSATEAKIRNALLTGGFAVVYQPIVDTATEALVGVEALVRMKDGDDLLAPARFISVAEDTGLVVGIDREVLAVASRQVADWNERFDREIELSVNMSAVHISRDDAFFDLVHVLDRAGFPASNLVIEINEGVFLDKWDDVAQRISRVRELGVRFAIDDFGTGYSSLAYLQRLPIDILKVDRAFVRHLGTSPENDAIVGAIIELATALHMTVVAEGVEEVQHLEALRRMECQFSQGYYFAKPAIAADFEVEWLAD